MHETKARRSWTQTSSRSHRCKRDELFSSLKSCAQIHSDASSIQKSRCKGGSGKTWENSGMEADESQKKEVIEEARSKGRKVHFSSLMDLCHQKNSELQPHCQECKGGAVLRGDIVKDDFLLDFEDKEFEETIKNTRRNLETPMAPAMPCKTCKRSKHGETRSKTNFNPKFTCILEASESTRMRMEESLPNYHEDHIAGRGDNQLQHYNLGHTFIPMPQTMKIPAAKAAVDKERWKLENISAWNLTKVRSKQRGDRWCVDEGLKSSFCLAGGRLSFGECRVGAKAPKIERSRCTPRWQCERRFRTVCCMLLSKDRQHHKWQQQKQ